MVAGGKQGGHKGARTIGQGSKKLRKPKDTAGFTKVRSEVPNLKKILHARRQHRPTDMPVYDANGGVAGVDLTAFPDAAATVLFSTFTTCMAA